MPLVLQEEDIATVCYEFWELGGTWKLSPEEQRLGLGDVHHFCPRSLCETFQGKGTGYSALGTLRD